MVGRGAAPCLDAVALLPPPQIGGFRAAGAICQEVKLDEDSCLVDQQGLAAQCNPVGAAGLLHHVVSTVVVLGVGAAAVVDLAVAPHPCTCREVAVVEALVAAAWVVVVVAEALVAVVVDLVAAVVDLVVAEVVAALVEVVVGVVLAVVAE